MVRPRDTGREQEHDEHHLRRDQADQDAEPRDDVACGVPLEGCTGCETEGGGRGHGETESKRELRFLGRTTTPLASVVHRGIRERGGEGHVSRIRLVAMTRL